MTRKVEREIVIDRDVFIAVYKQCPRCFFCLTNVSISREVEGAPATVYRADCPNCDICYNIRVAPEKIKK